MPSTPGFADALPAAYKDNLLAELAAELGIRSIAGSEWEADFTLQEFTATSYGEVEFSLTNPATDARWAYHVGVIQDHVDAKRFVIAKGYCKRIATEIWLPEVNTQIDTELSG